MDIVNVGTVGHCDHIVSNEQKALYAEIKTLRAKVASAENDIKDAERYRWLAADHDNKDTRQKCRDLLSRLGVMSYSAASSEIDQAIAQEVK